MSLERNYTEVFYINAKQKQKDFVEKRGDIFMLREGEEEKHQNILVKFSRDLHLHALLSVLLLNP